MPNRDGTGYASQGAGTGRGFGNCDLKSQKSTMGLGRRGSRCKNFRSRGFCFVSDQTNSKNSNLIQPLEQNKNGLEIE